MRFPVFGVFSKVTHFPPSFLLLELELGYKAAEVIVLT